MTEIDTMKRIIKYEYEKEELIKYNPRSFKDYLFDKLVELRVKINNYENN